MAVNIWDMIKLLVPLILLLLGWVILLVLARRNEKKVQSEWQTLLTPAGQKIFDHARLDVESNTAMVRVTMVEAMEIRELGNVDEAVRFLNIGSQVIERFTPNLLSLLSVMTKFSRMVSAMAPVQPILPQDFRLAEVVNLAHLHRILHQMLISTKQQFKLRLFVLGKGIAITSNYLLNRIRNVVTNKSESEQEWEEIMASGHDLQKLSEESVQSFRALLEALSNDNARALAQEWCLTEGSSNCNVKRLN